MLCRRLKVEAHVGESMQDLRLLCSLSIIVESKW